MGARQFLSASMQIEEHTARCLFLSPQMRGTLCWWILVEARTLRIRHPFRVPFLFNYSSGEGTHSGAPLPCFYACGLVFVVINDRQAQQGGPRLGEGPAHRAASLHTLNKAKPLQQFEPVAQSRRRNTQRILQLA